MTTNSSITLFHKRYNNQTKIDEWDRYTIQNTMWQGGKGASVNKGYERANDVSIWMPYIENENLDTIPFAIGDIVVKGTITTDITKQSDLKVDNYNIMTLINNNYGSYNMQHIHIGAK